LATTARISTADAETS